MLQSVSSIKSLIYWQQNINNTGIYQDKLFLKENYISFFQTIADRLATFNVSFVKLWMECMNNELARVHAKILADNKNNSEQADRICNKFRGNCGEIFAEAFFNAGYMSKYCEVGTYAPVDPTHERFIDATAVSAVDGLPIGIQIKNYNEHNLVASEIYKKAAAEDDLWIRHDKRIPLDKIVQFMSSPHQYLFSFTDSSDILQENYREAVVLIGPKEIDNARLQGDKKNGIPGKARFFQNIVEEIANLN